MLTPVIARTASDGRRAEGDDLQTLRRRFEAFVGLALTAPRIESGLARLGIDRRPFGPGDVTRSNALMVRYAEDRAALPGRWRAALLPQGERETRLVRELRLLHRPRGRLLSFIGAWLARRHLSHLARAVVAALVGAELISPGRHRVVVTGSGPQGARCTVALDGAGYLDQSRFVATLAEMFDRLASLPAAPQEQLLRRTDVVR